MTFDVQAEADIPVETIQRWHWAIADELREAFEVTLPSKKFTLGPQLERFEQSFASYCGATKGIGISSGTEALHLALRALGVGPEDEVITIPNTYVATAFAITYTGATPVFIDIEPTTHNLDAKQLRYAVNKRTKVILPVHMYGRVTDIDAIREAAPGIPILEDAAHAHGAEDSRNRRAGSIGDAGAFSFYPSKILGALGDGGAITTSDSDLADRIRQLRYMGQTTTKHRHERLGYQQRLDELQAAFLLVKLHHLETQLMGRQRVASRYCELLFDTPLALPAEVESGRHAYYAYTVLAPDRDKLAAHLHRRGIGTQVMYPTIVTDQSAYLDHPYRCVGQLPVARSQVAQLLCLPMFAELREEEIIRVANAIREFYNMEQVCI